MKHTIILLLFSCALWGQTKKRIEILISPNTPFYIYDNRFGSSCGTPYEWFLINRKKIDSLQTILDNKNELIVNKDYIYSMNVFDDYSYQLVKQYKFSNWFEESLFNTRVLEQSANPS
jgi:hypothetical protein